MTKYTFSKGRVMVENGVYVPLLKRDRRASRAAMVALLARLPLDDDDQPETSTQDKEQQPHVINNR
jgi:hypothetical protein